MIINSGLGCGRFGNTLIRNLLALVLSNKFNTVAIYEYSYSSEFIKLGLPTNSIQHDFQLHFGNSEEKTNDIIKKCI